jgi:hypothetical protein
MIEEQKKKRDKDPTLTGGRQDGVVGADYGAGEETGVWGRVSLG